MFGSYFSTYKVKQEVNVKELLKELVKAYNVSAANIINVGNSDSQYPSYVDFRNSEVFIILKPNFCVAVRNDLTYILYDSSISVFQLRRLIEVVLNHRIVEKPVKKFYMVQQDFGFSLAEFKITPCEIDINTHYNNDFIGIDNLICTSLKSNGKNGLILLHGKYGTGKTYYLRHLINTIGRKFIYFPLNMVSSLSSPDFLPFIAEHKNSVLILEDCENLLLKRENGFGNSSAISNLLNIGDGLLSDALKINIICTFNTGVKKIDEAILRKGRLIANYEFNELETSKAQLLLSKLGHKIDIKNPMTVSEIYNLNSQGFEAKKANPIGFK